LRACRGLMFKSGHRTDPHLFLMPDRTLRFCTHRCTFMLTRTWTSQIQWNTVLQRHQPWEYMSMSVVACPSSSFLSVTIIIIFVFKNLKKYRCFFWCPIIRLLIGYFPRCVATTWRTPLLFRSPKPNFEKSVSSRPLGSKFSHWFLFIFCVERKQRQIFNLVVTFPIRIIHPSKN
jgi:hypothetical protein